MNQSPEGGREESAGCDEILKLVIIDEKWISLFDFRNL